ncbi:hypothetical protein F5X98DRAFT_95407 [Xylaria grammica]|nr:hypothetical protein F5X98DRAFT_95407 [Xylaria grammica]
MELRLWAFCHVASALLGFHCFFNLTPGASCEKEPCSAPPIGSLTTGLLPRPKSRRGRWRDRRAIKERRRD